ncbi:MAG: DUF3568 family protein [Phycisphaerales bacterium]|nr:DUF3568 family protein [Phycisphaerales bacterium]
MRKTNWARAIAAGAIGLMGVTGCQTTRKVTGTRFEHFSANPDEVVEAAKGAAEELGLQMITSTSSKVDGQLQAQTAQGKTVTIEVNREAEGVSKVAVKVGTLGDEAVTNAILEKTRARLDKK